MNFVWQNPREEKKTQIVKLHLPRISPFYLDGSLLFVCKS